MSQIVTSNHPDHGPLPTAATRRLRTLLAAVAPVAVALFAAPALGQFQAERPQEDLPGRIEEPLAEAADEPIVPAYSVTVGSNFTTAYYFRGILQQPDGLLNGGIIAQPYVEVGIPLIADPDKGYAVSAKVGQWNSFGSEQPENETGPEAWYESDLYAGLSFTTGAFELAGIYTFYTSPNNSFPTVQEVGAIASYGLAFGDNPEVDDEAAVELGLSAGLFYELDNTATPNPVLGESEEGAYLELGAAPAFELEVGAVENPVELSFPVTVGLSLADYYFDEDGDDEFFGYVSVAAAAGIPLPVPADYGDWRLVPSVEALFLGANSLEVINNDDSSEFIGSLEVVFEF